MPFGSRGWKRSSLSPEAHTGGLRAGRGGGCCYVSTPPINPEGRLQRLWERPPPLPRRDCMPANRTGPLHRRHRFVLVPLLPRAGFFRSQVLGWPARPPTRAQRRTAGHAESRAQPARNFWQKVRRGRADCPGWSQSPAGGLPGISPARSGPPAAAESALSLARAAPNRRNAGPFCLPERSALIGRADFAPSSSRVSQATGRAAGVQGGPRDWL